MKQLGNQGNAIAQAQVGLLYLNGQGTPQDYGQAAPWLRKAAGRKAAAQGNAVRFG